MPTLDPPTPTTVERLEWLAFGYLLGQVPSRKKVRPSAFTHELFQKAFVALRDGNSYDLLATCLAAANVEWKHEDGPPGPMILAALERDGRYAAAIDAVNQIVADTCREGWEHRKVEFTERMLRVAETLEAVRDRVDDPAVAMRRIEQRKQELDAKPLGGG